MSLNEIAASKFKLVIWCGDNHEHLISSDWGGGELTSDAISKDSKLLHQVKIYCLKGDKFQF